ncbi:hypothetical protein [Bdellovibrio sp. HCB209]|uniref:hypothetical protein n=1 Tax=Bdellovibrio sp. HCB209 TaxID=3394354 RepID=UPI0039B4BA2F
MNIYAGVVSALLFSSPVFAQIADGSFFPSVRSINPGIAHQRKQALISLDVSKKDIHKDHAVTTGGIVGGVQTDVALQKNTLFGATKGSWVTFEALVDRETGDKTEHINSTTYGVRDVKNSASSNYFGGILDFKILGLGYATANYDTFYKFRVGEPPDVSAKDMHTVLNYQMLKAGTAFNIGGFTFGAFGMNKTSTGDYTYTFYNPTTGNPGSTEVWPAKTSANGYGVGLGYTSKTLRLEVSQEHMSADDLTANDNPLEIIKGAPASSRLSGAAEVRFGKLALGVRVRNYTGNFTDLEDLIPSNLLYGEMGESDTRLETSFNFAFGSDKGFTFSGFYSQSEAKTDEESTIFANGVTYPATTKSTAYGVNVSYYF